MVVQTPNLDMLQEISFSTKQSVADIGKFSTVSEILGLEHTVVYLLF